MRMKLLFKILGGVVALIAVVLIGVNMLMSADAVRDRVASRVKEQTGRDLRVNGSTTLLLLPNPHIVLTDVAITDPQGRPGGDLSIARLALDVSFSQLISRKVDAKRVVMERPVLTVRLAQQPAGQNLQQQGDLGDPSRDFAAAPVKFIAAAAAGDDDASRRDVMLNDVRIEDGTVRIVYGDSGDERRIEKISASLSLPHLVDPLTAKGDFDWKGVPVGFDLALTSPADLQSRSARLEFGLTTEAINANFTGAVSAKPAFGLEGDLTAKSKSVPSLLAWMRQQPPTETAIGNGELSSHIAWQPGEVNFTQTRFALSHATGQGQAVLTLNTPRPHLRAALGIESLILDPFFASAAPPAAGAQPPAESVQLFYEIPAGSGSVHAAEPEGQQLAQAEPAGAATQAKPDAASVVLPAAFDADVNVNINETKWARLVIGPSSLSFAMRDGVLDANLVSMQLYQGQGSGKLRLNGAQPVPTFTSDIVLDNVAVQPLLNGAAGFNLIAGTAKVGLHLNGGGSTAEEIKQSISGKGELDISDGSVQGINLTELIASVGSGRMPDLEQGPGAKTEFSTLGGSFSIASGVAESHDLQMVSPLLKVTARGTIDMVTGTVDFLTQPEIVSGPKGGTNSLAGLSIPVRIEGPFANPTFKPEVKGLFNSPGAAGQTVRQIGDMLQKNLKGKPVGEAIGRMLGSVRIGSERSAPQEQDQAPPQAQKAKPDQGQGEPPAEGEEESRDPDLDNILR